MVEVAPQGDDIILTVRDLHKVWAFKSLFTIPRAHIAEARQDPATAQNIDGLRALGASVPWGLKAGTFYLDYALKPAFVDIANPAHAVVVTLRDEEYQHLIIEVEDPVAVVALLGPGSIA